MGTAGVAAAIALAACAHAGDLSIVNDGPEGIMVDTGEEEFEVAGYGGIVLLNYGCTPGDVTIRFEGGSETVLPGPICPESEIIVGVSRASLRPAE